MKNEAQIKRLLLLLILVSTIIRGIIASLLEFGNDEVYYWTYALYPDLSHFDHPPMVGWMIQLFSLDLFFNNEFFIRLSSILFGGVNTWLIYMIGKKMKDPITGWYAALIYTASIYCFIICGVFILPDTPQVLFWLISVYLLISVLPGKPGAEGSNRKIIIAGITIGLALLSKYTSVFLWFGAALYIILYNREWLRSKGFLKCLISNQA